MEENKKFNHQKVIEGEQIASDFFQKIGYKILNSRWKWGKHDIDLILEKDGIIVFVEVKTRFSNVFGEPWEAVNNAKRKTLCRLANEYISAKDITLEPRFDIFSILIDGNKVSTFHIEDAFRPMA
jgi:putative endonuclease